MQSDYELTGTADGPEVLLKYRGKVDDECFTALLDLAEHKLEQEEIALKVKRKVFKVLLESLQNVYHHFDEVPAAQKAYPVTFALKKDKFTYYITTGNTLSYGKAKKLKSFIDNVNKLNPNQLKSRYRDKLSSGKVSAFGGAGLGIMDIIRRSGEKIAYHFKPVNKDYSYFSLNVKVQA